MDKPGAVCFCSAFFLDRGRVVDEGANQTIWREAQAYWNGLIDFERKQARPEDLKLERMRALLAGLGNPHEGLRIIHVAGTKGKGSCCAMIESILRMAGWRTGLFISPHISHVRERFQIDGIPISETRLGHLVNKVKEAAECHLKEVPSFFEVATAVAFQCFKDAWVDWVVLETGLGGRLDSTNVCHPILTLITGIALDHQQILGDTLEQIAYEKAGIIKPGIPVISGVFEGGAAQVIRDMARFKSAPIWEFNREIDMELLHLEATGPGWDGLPCRIRTPVQEWPRVKVGLAGSHQARNAALVIGLVDYLRVKGTEIPPEAVLRGIQETQWPGRVETVSKKPWIILDAAHNPASVGVLGEMLKDWQVGGKKALVFAVSRDKAVGEMLDILVPLFDEIHLTRYTSGQRAMSVEELSEILKQRGLARPGKTIEVHPTPDHVLQAILPRLRPDMGLCFAGSIFLLGEVRDRVLHWKNNRNNRDEPVV